MRYRLESAHWRIPSEARAFDGWLEGAPTPDQRAAILDEVARKRETWAPSKEAWSQFRDLEHFVEQHVRIQFWDRIMFLLEDEGPHPMLANCKGIIVLRQEGFLQAYLILDQIEGLSRQIATSGVNAGSISLIGMISGRLWTNSCRNSSRRSRSSRPRPNSSR